MGYPVVSISVGSTNAQPSVMKGAAAWPHVRSEFGDHSFGIMCFFLQFLSNLSFLETYSHLWSSLQYIFLKP